MKTKGKIIIIVLCIAVFVVASFGISKIVNKDVEPLTVEKFKAVMNDNNIDMTDQTVEGVITNSKESVIGVGENDSRYEFYIMDDSAAASDQFESIKDDIEKNHKKNGVNTEVEISGYQKKTASNAKEYVAVVRNEDSVLYIYAAKSDADTAKAILKALEK